MIQALPISKVKPGMILAEDVMNQKNCVLARKGVMLTDRLIHVLFRNYRINEVMVTDENSQHQINDVRKEKVKSPGKEYTSMIKQLSLLDSAGLLGMIKNEVVKDAKMTVESNFVQHPKKVEHVFLNAVEDEQILELLLKLRVISGNGREDFNRYIKTALLSIATGINLNIAYDQLVLLAKAALVYDIGNCIVDQNLLNTNGSLSNCEKRKLEEHVIVGFQILSEKFPEEISLPAYQHHERYDGSGYPNGIQNDKMHLFSKIIAISDVFTALSTSRSYRPAHPTSEVIEYLLGSGNILFDYKIVSEFLKIVNIYVVGSLVLLNNGDIGMVSDIENKPIGKPVVKLLYDKDWRSLHGKEVDLSSNHLYFIKRLID